MCVNHKYQNLKSYKYFQELSDKGIDGWGEMKSQRHAGTDREKHRRI
jgi:hypothetical protein